MSVDQAGGKLLGKCDGKYKIRWTSSPTGFYALAGGLSPVKKIEKKGKKIKSFPTLLGVGAAWQGLVQQCHFSTAIFSQLKCFLDFMQQRGWDFPKGFGPEKDDAPEGKWCLNHPSTTNWIFLSGKWLDFFALSLVEGLFAWFFVLFCFGLFGVLFFKGKRGWKKK